MIGLTSIEIFVEISSSAKNEIKRQMQEAKIDGLGIRIYVIKDRFDGFAFDLELSLPGKNEKITKVDGIPVFVESQFSNYVKGMKIDFDIGKNKFSLVNENPQYNCIPGSKYECPTCNLYDPDAVE